MGAVSAGDGGGEAEGNGESAFSESGVIALWGEVATSLWCEGFVSTDTGRLHPLSIPSAIATLIDPSARLPRPPRESSFIPNSVTVAASTVWCSLGECCFGVCMEERSSLRQGFVLNNTSCKLCASVISISGRLVWMKFGQIDRVDTASTCSNC